MHISPYDALGGLEERFGPQPLAIVRRLQTAGYDAVIVGGPVRDTIMGHMPQDVDIATSATPDVVRRLFARTFVQGSGEVHGTIGVVVGGSTYEVTTYRRDVETDGRHATVVFASSIEEDLARRDFTINAVAVRPHPKDDTGDIIDPFKGQIDMADKCLRAVGDPSVRFQEDYLRILRAYRFAARYQLQIEPTTRAAISASRAGLSGISRERIRDELLKMAAQSTAAGAFAYALSQMQLDGVLQAILPEVSLPAGVTHADTASHTNPRLRIALLLRACGVDAVASICRRLAFSNVDKGYICELARCYQEVLGVADAGSSASTLRRLAHGLRAGVTLRDTLEMLKATSPRSDAIEKFESAIVQHEIESPPLRLKDLAVTGQDIMVTTGAKGPEVGQRLQALLDAVLENPELNTKDSLLAMLAPAPHRPSR